MGEGSHGTPVTSVASVSHSIQQGRVLQRSREAERTAPLVGNGLRVAVCAVANEPNKDSAPNMVDTYHVCALAVVGDRRLAETAWVGRSNAEMAERGLTAASQY